jgi:hypothetical protein
LLLTSETIWWLGLLLLAVLVLGIGGGLGWCWWKGIALGPIVVRYWRRVLNGCCWLLAVLVAARTLEYAWTCKGHVTCDFAGQWLIGRMMGQGRGYQLYLVKPQREVLAHGYHGNELEWMYRDLLLKGMWNSQPDTTLPRSEIEGPLYPPIWGMITMLWAWLPPEPAHRVVVLIYALLAFVAAWCIRVATGERLRTGEAALAVWVFPNCYHGLVLGQNAIVTLFLVAAGLALWRRGRLWSAGLVWGLLAYKPVFFVALAWLPLVLMAWRVIAGMLTSAAVLLVATIPMLLPPLPGIAAESDSGAGYKQILKRVIYWDDQGPGWRIALSRDRLARAWEVWRRWWQVGQRAADVYDRDENWVWMSRDLYALPRRPIWDWPTLQAHWRFGWGQDYWPDARDERGSPLPTWRWERPEDAQNHGAVLVVRKDGSVLRLQQVNAEAEGLFFGLRLPVTFLSRLLLILVGMVTATIAFGLSWWRQRRQLAPPAFFNSPLGAFCVTGGLLTCFHFMHYDLHPFVVPLLMLVACCFRPEWWEWEAERPWPRLSWLLGRAGAVFAVTVLATSWLACYYNLAFQRGAVRFPFETILALIQWLVAGTWTVLEHWPGRSDGRQQFDEKTHGRPIGEVIGGWSPQPLSSA